MAKVKAAIKTMGDHKQKIIINVSTDGVKITDEKTEVSLKLIIFVFSTFFLWWVSLSVDISLSSVS